MINSNEINHKTISIKNILKLFQIKKQNSGVAYGSYWQDCSTYIKSFCPTDNSLISEIGETNDIQLQLIIEKTKEAYIKWRMVPSPKRAELVRLIGQKLRQYKDALGTIISYEMGKSKQEGDGEVQEMIDMADFAVGLARMLYGNSMHSEREDHRMYEQWHPLGVIAIISAFNFPVAVWSWNAFIALICGNSVIWKPSPKTPICSIIVHKICAEIITEHNYPNVLSIINSSNTNLIEQLINNPNIPLVSFTGSSKIGKLVATQLASRFARSLLELGGNNAVILDNSANLKKAIPSIVFSAIGTAGQRCTTLRRLFIHKDIYKETLTQLKNAYAQIKVGDPLDTNNHMGPLIDQDAVNKFNETILELKKLKAKIIYGGNIIKQKGNFVEPTIIEAQASWDIVKEETFAPILYVIPYKTLEEAIEYNNNVNYGLSSAIYTENLNNMEKFLSPCGSDCGIANINIGTSGAEIGGAFGGEKATGGGREAGSDSWKIYMRRQTTTINYGDKLTLAQGIKFDL
jgi:aldehyde dehydrogenase (NAD+)